MRILLLLTLSALLISTSVNAGELHIAAANNDEVEIKKLLADGAEINELDSDPKSEYSHPMGTPLHWAALHGALNAVQLLIDSGSNVNIKENYGDCLMVSTAIDYAVGTNNYEITEILLKAGASPEGANHSFFWPLQIAAENENLEIMALLLKHGVNIHKAGVDGYTALHHAIWKKKLKSIAFLVRNGADLNRLPEYPNSQTAREFAQVENDREVLKLLETLE